MSNSKKSTVLAISLTLLATTILADTAFAAAPVVYKGTASSKPATTKASTASAGQVGLNLSSNGKPMLDIGKDTVLVNLKPEVSYINPIQTFNNIQTQSQQINTTLYNDQLTTKQAAADQNYETTLTNVVNKDVAKNFGLGLTQTQVNAINADLGKEGTKIGVQVNQDGLTNPSPVFSNIENQSLTIANDLNVGLLTAKQATAGQAVDGGLTKLVNNDIASNGVDALTTAQIAAINADLAKENTTIGVQINRDGLTNPSPVFSNIESQSLTIANDLNVGLLTAKQAAADQAVDGGLTKLVENDTAINGVDALTTAQIAVISADLAKENTKINSQLH